MATRDFLTEDEVIQGVTNFLSQKGRTTQKRLINKSDAKTKQHGVDLKFKLENDKKNGNWYIIEAKGNLRSDGTKMLSASNTNLRWAISQIILRITVDSRNNNYIYGIAMPKSDVVKSINSDLIKNNWALKHLKIRFYGSFRDDAGNLTATEYLPSQIYAKKKVSLTPQKANHRTQFPLQSAPLISHLR